MSKIKSSSSFHLAGIIPVAGQGLDFNFPWHDCLQPISQNYLAVERAVVECAYAGCETIWIVCHDDMQPLIRYRIGDYVQDPVYLYRSFEGKHYSDKRKPIPIYYVPVHPKDRDKRDCLAWSVLYGALSSYWTSIQISKWVTPSRYYVAFPYGVYDPEILREHRKDISSHQGFYLKHNNKTIKDGEYLGFTFDGEEFKRYRKELRGKATGLYTSENRTEEGYPRERLPIQERYSARHFSLDTVFESAIIEGAKVVNLPWYSNIDSWKGLREYLSSDNQLERPRKELLSYHEFNTIGENIDD